MNKHSGFAKGFVAASAAFVALYAIQAYAGGVVESQTQTNLREVERSLEKIASELSALRRDGLPVKIENTVPVKVQDEVTVRTGFYGFEVKTK